MAVGVGAIFAIVIAILVLPALIDFVVFLMSGDVWRALAGVALISFIVGLVLAAVIGLLERRKPSAPDDEPSDRVKGGLWTLVWVFLLAAPVCLVVALIASGTLVDVVQWSGDRSSEIRDAQGSS